MLADEFVHGGHECERTRAFARFRNRTDAYRGERLRRLREHPRAAAPERDPQPSRHRSPEHHRP
ncbi:hypothetical protein STXM2123_1646 [Streptomyces sp. F-3]|nr:hypothetical protein STXM2123_1646 [Streptomyces sp. F-3]